MTNHPSRSLDSKVRRAAKAVGLTAVKARGPLSRDNYGGYNLVNENNFIVSGEKYSLSAEDVLERCKPLPRISTSG